MNKTDPNCYLCMRDGPPHGPEDHRMHGVLVQSPGFSGFADFTCPILQSDYERAVETLAARTKRTRTPKPGC